MGHKLSEALLKSKCQKSINILPVDLPEKASTAIAKRGDEEPKIPFPFPDELPV